MNFSQVRPIEVCVDLGRGDIGVPEHLLHGCQISTALKEMSGKRVPNSVRGHSLLDAGKPDVLTNYLPSPHPAQGTAAAAEEEHTLSFRGLDGKPGPRISEIRR